MVCIIGMYINRSINILFRYTCFARTKYMCRERRGRDGADVGYHGNHLLLIENQPDDESIKRDRTQVPLDLWKTDSTRSLYLWCAASTVYIPGTGKGRRTSW